LKEAEISLEIQAMLPEHWEAVKDIYEKGIATGQATFQTSAPASWELWDQVHLPHSRFVATTKGKVIGWVALSRTSARDSYKGVCELSIYINPAYSSRGIGKLLMKVLVQSSEENGVWSLYSSTFPENTASIALQKKFGFREIGFRERIAQQNGVWRDTFLLERRSKIVGI
jgi:L-amino acid N-acyltransferase YncA